MNTKAFPALVAEPGSELHPRRRGLRGAFYLIVLLLLGSSREALGQIQPATAELIDAKGTVIGPVLDYNGSGGGVRVPLLIDGHTTILLFFPGTVGTVVAGGGMGGVFFASADCTGQGFAPNLGPDDFLEPQAIGGPRNTFFAGPASPTAPGAFTFNSVLLPGQACSAASGTFNALPVNPVRDLTPPWQPPFRLVNSPAASSVPAVSAVGLLILALALGGLSVALLRSREAKNARRP